MDFTIEQNRHIFACWAASRAAGVSPLCRFKVNQGKSILDVVFKYGTKIDALKQSQTQFDKYHENLIEQVIQNSKKINIKMNYRERKTIGMSYGVAAKLVNVYLKVTYICPSYKNDKKIKFIHPPIDSILLKTLYNNKIGENIKLWKIKWSKMEKEDYKKVITEFKKLVRSDGLWLIEKFWLGYQK